MPVKTTALLLATATILAFAVAAAGFALDAVAWLSISATAGIVGLFLYEYRRIRRRFIHGRTRRRLEPRPPPQAGTSSSADQAQAMPLPPAAQNLPLTKSNS